MIIQATCPCCHEVGTEEAGCPKCPGFWFESIETTLDDVDKIAAFMEANDENLDECAYNDFGTGYMGRLGQITFSVMDGETRGDVNRDEEQASLAILDFVEACGGNCSFFWRLT